MFKCNCISDDEKKPIFDVPCYGDRRFGFVQDHEFVFSIPAELAENLVEGLEETHKAGTRYPVPVYLNWTPKMPKGFEVTEEDLK